MDLLMRDSLSTSKRRRFNPVNPMESEAAKAKLAAAKEKFGRDIRVFETSASSLSTTDDSNAGVYVSNESDDFYDLTPEDYRLLMATKKEANFLKTKKIRDAEEATRRSKISKSVIRVRFPDNYTFEAVFHPSETIQSLVDLLTKVVNHPEVPFYLYTIPPKKQIKDMSQDFYSAGFIPGAIVYFAYDLPKDGNGDATSGPFLKDEIISLQGLEAMAERAKVKGDAETEGEGEGEAVQAVKESRVAASSSETSGRKTDKKNIKPKWLKL